MSSSESGTTGDDGFTSDWEFVNPLEVERSPIVAAYMKKHGIALPEVPEEHIRLWKAWVTKQRRVSPQRHGGNQGLSQASESSSETGLSLISGESEEDWPQEAQKAQEDATQGNGGHGESRSGAWERIRPEEASEANKSPFEGGSRGMSSSESGTTWDDGFTSDWEFVNPLEVERSPIVAAYMKKHGIALPEVPEEHIRLWKAWVTKNRVSRMSERELGPTKAGCTYHSSDYAPQDWTISITELLRTIQFFNTPGGYEPCDYGEDGYCPVVE